MVLAYLCCAKKGLVFLNFNQISLREGKNLFNLDEFDGWRQSDQFKSTLQMAESHHSQYDKLWDYLLNQRYNYQWNQEDANKVINQLDQNMDQNFLHTVIGFKLQELMQLQNDMSLQDHRPQLLRGILYLNGAQKSEELLIYNPGKPINWKEFYNIIDNSDVYQLSNIIGNIH